MKEKLKKKKIILILSTIAVLTIGLISLIGLFTMNKLNKEGKSQIKDRELARAMTYEEFTEEDEKTNSDFVRFGAFFLRDLDGDGYAEKIKGTSKRVGESDELYMSLNVLTEGTLTEGKIEIQGENVFFQTALVDDEVISGNYVGNNTSIINLKDVKVGTQKLIFGNVRSGNYNNNYEITKAIGNDTTKYSRSNKVILTGKHIANDGTETEIRKEIELPVDWYGETKAEIPYTYAGGNEKNKYQSYNTENILDLARNVLKIKFKLVSQETNNKLLLSKAHIEGEIPELNGYKPSKVEITGRNVEYSYDETTGKYEAWRNARIDENGKIIETANSGQWDTQRYNEFDVLVEYPMEAYDTMASQITYKVPIRAYYEGYNNINEEFENPYKSNVAEDIIVITYNRGGGDVFGYRPTIGTYVGHPYNTWVISKEKAAKKYNNVDGEDLDTQKYDVRWEISRGAEGIVSGVKIYEPATEYEDRFIKTNGSEESIIDISRNVGIYFTGLGGMLGENGYLNLFDNDTNELIHTFTKDDWDLYTKENPYIYEKEVKHIRIETSSAEKNSIVVVNQVKEIDNNKLLEKYKTIDEFNSLSKVGTTVTGEVEYTEGSGYTKLINKAAYANYDEPLSNAIITGVNPDYISTQETAESMKIYIGTASGGYNIKNWKNGVFLLKFPEEIILTEVNKVSISDSSVKILGYDIFQDNGIYFLKILTENETPAAYNITVDCNITPDPRKLSATREIELYAYNEECHNYKSEYKAKDIYDINDNTNLEEYMDYSKRALGFVGPTSLLTTETASEYDSTGSTLETAIAPQIAIIDKGQDNKTAKVSVQILNNYTGNVSEVKIVGKIPFEGNTFQLNGHDLGSTYTTTLTGPIVLPEKLQEVAEVYYSEKEIVTEDLTNAENGWTKDVTDFSKIKTYLIDLRDYVVPKGEEYICTYEIRVPDTVNYNDVAYSTHGVYFCLETQEGKLRDKTETNKLGFMIARKYDLEINKTKKGSENKIQGAVFSVQEEGKENSRILATNVDGKISIKDLYVDRVYTIKEIKTPYDYVLNPTEIKFKASVVDGELVVTKINGETKGDIGVKDGENKKIVEVNVENEPKFTFKLTKYVTGTADVIQGVRFRIKGKGLPSSGRIATTNTSGEINIKGLYPNEIYSIVEEYAKGYEYSGEEIQFKTFWNGNNLEAEVISGSFKDVPAIDNSQEKQPIMSAELENTKLKEYGFNLVKYEKDSDKVLPNATFKITGKWLDEEIKTNENGLLSLPVLYENIEYTIEEIMAPEGYAVNANKVKFSGTFDENGQLIIRILEGELIEDKLVDSQENTSGEGIVTDVDGNKILDKEAYVDVDENGKKIFVFGFDNEQLFKLIKKDGTTKEPLPNVKFAIKKINDDKTEEDAKDTLGNVVGEEETINGVVYRVVKTDENGEIKTDLQEGIYKVIEVEALEGYEFAEDVEERSYYFGIGKSKPAVKEAVAVWDNEIEGNELIGFKDGTATSDGGHVIIGNFQRKIKISGEKTKNGEDIVLNSYGNSDGIIIKYDINDKIEWAKNYGHIQSDTFFSVIENSKGNIIVIGRSAVDFNNILMIEVNKDTGELIEEDLSIKIGQVNSTCENKIIETADKGYLITGQFSSMIVPKEKTEKNEEIIKTTTGTRDGMIIKYNSEKKVEWVFTIGGAAGESFIQGITELEDGGIIGAGHLSKGSYIIDEETIEYEGKAVVRLNKDGVIEKVFTVGTGGWTQVNAIENGYIVAGTDSYGGKIVTTVDGEEINLVPGAMAIKYNINDEIEWVSQTRNRFLFKL